MKDTDINDLKAKDVMSKEPVVAAPEDSLSEVLGKMKRHGVHEVPVVERKKLVGIVSYNTLTKRRSLPMSTKVERIMVAPPRIGETDSVPEVAEMMMSTGSRGIPVTSKRKLLGFISRIDLIESVRGMKMLSEVDVSSIMSHSPQCVLETHTLHDARALMKDLDERSVPVCESSGHLIGVVGIRDLADYFARERESETRGEVVGEKEALEIEVGSLMRTPPITVPPDARLSEAIDLMIEKDVSSILVAENREPVGIVTQVDIIELIASFGKAEEVFVQITGLEEEPEIYDAMYERIQKTIDKTGEILSPKILNIHVAQHHSKGDTSKYTMRARLATDRGLFYARHFDWNIHKALDGLMDQIEDFVREDKERRLDTRKRSRRL
ncbi:MAG: CBS domain-containing protein [Thermoplasmata archaeon]|nr:CBS domain-containing protein [Candidatus Thermoplasmatota archaeon]MCK4948900.1 CBS domain-containing protein [Thermoplasmata archaeon]